MQSKLRYFGIITPLVSNFEHVILSFLHSRVARFNYKYNRMISHEGCFGFHRAVNAKVRRQFAC